MKIISRNAAIGLGLNRYFTGVECKNGHINERYVCNHRCVTCLREQTARWKENNEEKTIQISKKHKNNMTKEQKARSYEARKRWQEKNKDRFLLSRRKSSSNHYRKNKERYSAHKIKRKAAEQQSFMRHPEPYQEMNEFFMKEIYLQAAEIRGRFSVKVDVDHIVPIKGVNVCGFHVWNNLRIMPSELNRAKSNRIENGAGCGTDLRIFSSLIAA